MIQSLEDVRYLSDSEHRIAALELLLEGPKTQGELRAKGDASSATVSRMLRSFEERDWVVRRSGSYELTPIGRFVTTDFVRLQEHLEAIERLQTIIEWVPSEVVDLGVGCLVDATLTFSTATNPMAVVERATELGGGASRFRAVSHYLPMMCIDAHLLALGEGAQTLESVFSEELLETIARSRPEGSRQILAVLDSGRATLYAHEGDVPLVLGINDDVVYIGVENETGALVALIETSDETVFGWAEETFDVYRDGATQMTRDAFTELRASTA